MTFEANFDRFQTAAFRALEPGRKVVLAWGRGSGKTVFDRAAIHIKALQHPGIEIGLLLPTLKQARQLFWPKLFADYYGPLKPHMRGVPNRSLLEANYANGSRLTTWGAENADGIRGQRFGMVVSDEVDDMDPSVEAAVVEPTFSHAGSSAIWLKSGTPRRGRYGILYRDFKIAQDGDPGYWSQRVRSDESPWVDQAWLARVKARTLPGVYSREYECDFDSAEGLVYPFDESVHIRTPTRDVWFTERMLGCDWGWSDAGVFLDIGIAGHGADATVWILGETYETEKPNGWWDDRAKAHIAGGTRRFWCDPSRPDRIADLRRIGANAQGADNDIEHGVSRVAELLFVRPDESGNKHTRLYVDPSCVNTIREFNSYRRKRDPKNADSYLEAIEDRNNHAMDALRYACVGRFGLASGRMHIEAGR